jgi:hypothetical protein
VKTVSIPELTDHPSAVDAVVGRPPERCEGWGGSGAVQASGVRENSDGLYGVRSLEDISKLAQDPSAFLPLPRNKVGRPRSAGKDTSARANYVLLALLVKRRRDIARNSGEKVPKIRDAIEAEMLEAAKRQGFGEYRVHEKGLRVTAYTEVRKILKVLEKYDR